MVFENALHTYFSIADIVWVLGYVPLFTALYLRYRTLRSTPEPSRLARPQYGPFELTTKFWRECGHVATQ